MARTLTFIVNGDSLAVNPAKIDRSKIYGWSEQSAVDRQGIPCRSGYVSDDGCHIFGRESFGLGYVTKSGEWVEKSEFTARTPQGETLALTPSSFQEPITLQATATIDDYLGFTARSVYHLQGELIPKLLVAVKALAPQLYTFRYCYYASYAPDSAYLIENNQALFMIVGTPTELAYLDQQQGHNAVLDNVDDDEVDDALDFEML